MRRSQVEVQDVSIRPVGLAGALRIPQGARSIIVFAHGSGSSRFSRRNVEVADALVGRGFGTLLFDLLTDEEAAHRINVFDIPLLAKRVSEAVQWLDRNASTQKLQIGLFGASTGAAATLVAASDPGSRIAAIVSRGGRPDLAGDALERVRSPTLLIVGGADTAVLDLNRQALERLTCEKLLMIVPGATHLFPERGALESVTEHACRWFLRHAQNERRRDVLQE